MQIDVDGKPYTLTVDDPDMPLLYALRDELGFNNPHFGCGLAQCGACTVHVDGAPTRSCLFPLSAAVGKQITTLAGLGTPSQPHPLQTAFIEEQATQCGYCLNGWIMTAAALVRDNPRASKAEIQQALSGVKCRCGSHMSIIRAVARVTGAA
jgi:aerobic-type carbon monoxide dehydrogenase small subunit (CoxS/CutS family)